MTRSKEDLIRAIEAMSVDELLKLTKDLEDRLGITANPAPEWRFSTTMGMPAVDRWPEEYRTTRLKLIDAGKNRLHVLMFLRERFGDFGALPIAESKRLVDNAPSVLPITLEPKYLIDQESLVELKELGATFEVISVEE